jgi:hypothetical protein
MGWAMLGQRPAVYNAVPIEAANLLLAPWNYCRFQAWGRAIAGFQ